MTKNLQKDIKTIISEGIFCRIILCIIYFFLVSHSTITVLDRCNCRPEVKADPYRYGPKHDTAFSAYPERKSFITPETVRDWEKQYRINLLIAKDRVHHTPEDTLYNLAGWLYEVKTIAKDCDLHLQIGPENYMMPRIVVEIPVQECALQEQLIKELTKKGFKLDTQNYPGLYVEVKGLGFYDGKKKGRPGKKHEAGCSWELHPVKEYFFK